MPNIPELQERLKKAASIEDPLKKRLWILAVITEALRPYKIQPILVAPAGSFPDEEKAG
ncbi:MAG: hypothetical protein QME81_15790 [bacterium]|nr:hypothetical protein [bacterium]